MLEVWEQEWLWWVNKDEQANLSLSMLLCKKKISWTSWNHLGLVATKPVFGVSDKARLKPACPATETSKKITILLIASLDVIVFKKRIIKALISLSSVCADVQAGLCLCCSQTQKTGFLTSRPILTAYWVIFHVVCHLLIVFKINFFRKFFQEYHECQTVWIQIRPDILSGLIWVQTVCIGYQKMTHKELILIYLFSGSKAGHG